MECLSAEPRAGQHADYAHAMDTKGMQLPLAYNCQGQCFNLHSQVRACAIYIVLPSHKLRQKAMQGNVIRLVHLSNILKDLLVYCSHNTAFQGYCGSRSLCKSWLNDSLMHCRLAAV